MTLTEGKDFSRLLSQGAKARRPSPLKTCLRYFNDPNIIFLAGGLPRSKYFPWDNLTVDGPDMGADAEDGSAKVMKTEIKREGSAKAASGDGIRDIPLSRSLQYGTSEGQPELMDYIREHTNLVHQIQYDDWGLMVTGGNTLSWDYTLRVFCDPGDAILAEENCFSSALTAAESHGVVIVPVIMDENGIVPELLDELLEGWEKIHPGMGKPKLLYTVPTGQNPTGSCLPACRREQIYKIAQKHDFLIVEDEPYYFLQMEAYERDVSKRTERHFRDQDEFLRSLVKTFLSLDTDGRVIRLDSFSKVLAPGSRLGWITASKSILRNYLLLQETCLQAPSGFSTSIISGTLHRWGQEGYLRWLMNIRREYTRMRDNAMDAVHKYVPEVPYVRINPTVAGMFFTITLDASAHPEFETKYGSDPLKLETAMYESMLNSGVLFVPGSWFYVIDHTAKEKFEPVSFARNKNEIFFRGTFAATDAELLTEGIRRLGEAIRSEFGA